MALSCHSPVSAGQQAWRYTVTGVTVKAGPLCHSSSASTATNIARRRACGMPALVHLSLWDQGAPVAAQVRGGCGRVFGAPPTDSSRSSAERWPTSESLGRCLISAHAPGVDQIAHAPHATGLAVRGPPQIPPEFPASMRTLMRCGKLYS